MLEPRSFDVRVRVCASFHFFGRTSVKSVSRITLLVYLSNVHTHRFSTFDMRYSFSAFEAFYLYLFFFISFVSAARFHYTCCFFFSLGIPRKNKY